MKHLRLFKTEAEYSSATLELPNVSYVEDVKLVYYHPNVEDSPYVMVDLGLPSGLLWADRNIGAASPEDAGLYFQWADTVGYTAEQVASGEKKFASDWSDYFDTTDGGSTFNKYNNNGGITTLEASDDAATVNMGSDWRLPTTSELQELIDNTTPTFIDLQGNEFSESEVNSNAIAEYNLKGIKFTGSNGNSIFVPAAGYCYDAVLDCTYSDCSLWASSLNYNDSMHGDYLYFNYNGLLYIEDDYRYYGQPTRGVK